MNIFFPQVGNVQIGFSLSSHYFPKILKMIYPPDNSFNVSVTSNLICTLIQHSHTIPYIWMDNIYPLFKYSAPWFNYFNNYLIIYTNVDLEASYFQYTGNIVVLTLTILMFGLIGSTFIQNHLFPFLQCFGSGSGRTQIRIHIKMKRKHCLCFLTCFYVFYILITLILESPANLVGQPGQDWELCRSQNHPQILWSINQTLVPKLWTRKLKNAFIKYYLDLLLALISNNNEKKYDFKYMLNIYGIIFIY